MSSKDLMLSMKLPVFKKKVKNFNSWWIKIQLYMRVKDFHTVEGGHKKSTRTTPKRSRPRQNIDLEELTKEWRTKKSS